MNAASLRGPATAAVLLAGLCACGSDGGRLEYDGVVTYVQHTSGSGSEAGINGRITTAGSCLALDIGIQQPVPVVWPEGTELSDGALLLPSGRSVWLGDTIQGGGGFQAGPPNGLDQMAEECPPSPGGIAVVDRINE